MTLTCPTPAWLAEQEQREAERRHDDRMKRQLRRLTGTAVTAESVIRIIGELFRRSESEVPA